MNSNVESLRDMPKVSDSAEQTTAARFLESVLEPLFYEDSLGYPLGKSILNAVAVTRDRCSERDWLLKFDIQGTPDKASHKLLLIALHYHCNERWISLLVERLLKAPVSGVNEMPIERAEGIPPGGPLYPALSNLYLHYALDIWLTTEHPDSQFCRYGDCGILHCTSEDEAKKMWRLMDARLSETGLTLHQQQTQVVHCKDSQQTGTYQHTQISFLGNTFMPNGLRATVGGDNSPRRAILNANFRRGFIVTLPLAISAGAYGSVLGVLAAKSDVSVIELIAVNILMFAGSSQFIMVEMWQPQLPVVGISVAVLVVNIRYFLAGASLYPLYKNTSLLCKMSTIHFLVDESWAITLAEQKKGLASPSFLLGSGLCLMIIWNIGTLLGHQLGSLIGNPRDFALDFAFTAVFTGILVSLFSAKRDVAPWIVTIVASLVSYQHLPGNWYVVIGSLLGAFSSIWPIKTVEIDEQPATEPLSKKINSTETA